VIWVKICGVTRVEDARVVAESGADAIGFNFWSQSPRYVDPPAARRIGAELPSTVTRVGVFVDASRDEIEAIAEEALLDVVQLHGSEPPDLARSLSRRVIRAVRARTPGDLDGLADYPASALLVDAFVAGEPGGTGRRADWELARAACALGPVILAGGLDPENVGSAIHAVRPYGVDVASGVEAAPGLKDATKIRAFVSRAREAAATLAAAG